MPVTPSYRTFVLDQLARVAPQVRGRAMFGGVGIYSRDLFFALIADDELYLKADDLNRPDFEARGLGPFRPFGPGGEAMPYHPPPADALEDADRLRAWVAKAIDAARRSKAAKTKRAKKRPLKKKSIKNQPAKKRPPGKKAVKKQRAAKLPLTKKSVKRPPARKKSPKARR